MEQSEIEKRTLTLKRTFNAPRNLVWSAWTQPEHIAAWWGPPGMKTEVVTFDFTPGGQWKYIMRNDKGMEYPSIGTFSEIVAPEKIVTSADFSRKEDEHEIVITTALFEDAGPITNFTFTILHPSEEVKLKHEGFGVMNGWAACFNELEAFLAQE